ncbi:hypothetical protein OIU77_006553 [Salix suchowensis]|uniref:Uncharacterized protein n=1 Tax=Salix suchowensis TaxID=1278906 RepID=A0ABQ9AMK6_9ROSI|nr:hypothetical protein OIU77_006553 [Salix suchowensis]
MSSQIHPGMEGLDFLLSILYNSARSIRTEYFGVSYNLGFLFGTFIRTIYWSCSAAKLCHPHITPRCLPSTKYCCRKVSIGMALPSNHFPIPQKLMAQRKSAMNYDQD